MMTIWHCGNYGAEMQAYATVKALEMLGHEVELIDFRLYEPPHTLRALMGCALRSIAPAETVFERFWREKLPHVTRHYKSLDELRANPPHADLYLVGSDQVWNESIVGDREAAFLLDFGDEKVRRMSYASSIGVSEWRFSKDFTDAARRQFRKFSAISCREATGAEVLSRQFGLEVRQVLDPTLLHTDYGEITGSISEQKTLVFYPLSPEDTSAEPFCRELAGRLNLRYVNANPYVFVPFTHVAWRRNSIGRWLGDIAGAALVVTGSFHGLAFSLVHHRQFILINDNKQGRNSRMTDLLACLGLENRLFRSVQEAMDAKAWEEKIDYERVDEKLNVARRESWNYLKQNLI